MNIPFTTQQFFKIIEIYNSAVFPFQLIILIIGLVAIYFIHSKKSLRSKFIGGFLGVLWLWIGIVYHLVYFTRINNAAYGFGGLFILQGLLFFYETLNRDKLQFQFNGKLIEYVAYFFILFGLIIYPVLIYFLEDSIIRTITLGLPCPSTILTFGFLMLTNIKLPKYLLIIPTLWTIVGTSAAFNFGVYPDYFMALSALVAVVFLISRKNDRKLENMTVH